jgi:hypothetical protein
MPVVVDEVDPLLHGTKSTRHNTTQHNTPRVADILLKSRVYLKDAIIFLLVKSLTCHRSLDPPTRNKLMVLVLSAPS